MIIVKLLGSSKKSFLSERIEVRAESMTIFSLMNYLQELQPKHLLPLDIENILVAVNGIDSSALEGMKTTLKDGDVVSVIPLVHGGNASRTQFTVMNNHVELVRLKKILEDPIKFLEYLRNKYPNLVIQAIDARYILNPKHAKKIIAVSVSAQKTNILLSNKMETDILLRFACTKQIDDAILKVGIKSASNFILIVIGKKLFINKLFDEIKHQIIIKTFSRDNSRFIKQKFGITMKELNCTISKNQLEDLLTERAATLL